MNMWEFLKWLVENGGPGTWLLIVIVICALASAIVAAVRTFQ